MAKKNLRASDVKSNFKTQEELKIVRRELQTDKVPVGCKTYGMVLTSEKAPCDDPRCSVCKNRVSKTLQKAVEDAEWQARRDSRTIQGFFFGNFTSVAELEAEPGAKEGLYAFVGNLEDPEAPMVDYVFTKGNWQQTQEEKE